MKTKILGSLAVLALATPVHQVAAVDISTASPATINFDWSGLLPLTAVFGTVALPDGQSDGVLTLFQLYSGIDASGDLIGGSGFSNSFSPGASISFGSYAAGVLDGTFSLRLSTTSTSTLNVTYCLRPNDFTAPCASTSVPSVPEPGTLALLGLGLAGLGLSRRRRAN